MKQSGDPGPTSEVGDPTPEGDGTTPEGSLTLMSNLLLVVANIGLDILGKFTKLNITKYWLLSLISWWISLLDELQKRIQQLLQIYKNYLI